MGNCLISNKKEEDAATAEQNIAPGAAAPNEGVALGEVTIEESVKGSKESGGDSRVARWLDSGTDAVLALGSLVPFAGKFSDLLAALKARIQELGDTIDDAEGVIKWAADQEVFFQKIFKETFKSIKNLVLRDEKYCQRNRDDVVVRLWDFDVASEVEVELDEEAKKRRDGVIAVLVGRGAAVDTVARAFDECGDDVDKCAAWCQAQLERAQREVNAVYNQDFIWKVELHVQVHEEKNVLVGIAPASFEGWKRLDETLRSSFDRPIDDSVRDVAKSARESMIALREIADEIYQSGSSNESLLKCSCRWCSSMGRAELFKKQFSDAYRAAEEAVTRLTGALTSSMYVDLIMMSRNQKIIMCQNVNTQRQLAEIILILKGILSPQKMEALARVRLPGCEVSSIQPNKGGATVRFNPESIAAANKLQEVILNGGSLKEACGEGVSSDLGTFLGSYNHAKLRFTELTHHQQTRLDQLQGHKVALLLAPAGGGKTFIAIQRIADYLTYVGGDAVLFVARNEALALFVCKWLTVVRNSEEDVLKRVHVLVAPFADGPRSVHVETADGRRRLVFGDSRVDATAYGMVVVDEAHHLVDDDEANDEGVPESKGDDGIADSPGALRAQLTNIGAAQKHLLFLADASQATDSVPFALKMRNFVQHLRVEVGVVTLSEVVRSTKRIVAGAAAFQLRAGREAEMSTHGTNPGMPLLAHTFNLAPDDDEFTRYAQEIYNALNAVRCKLFDLEFHGAKLTDLDDCVAVVCPDEDFVKMLREPLKHALAGFEFVNAATASAVLEHSADAKPWLVLDSVDNLDGLERLVVICVDLDRDIDGGADVAKTRSRLYRAMTRAELAVAVVNRTPLGVWLEFFEHIELDDNGEFWGFNAEQKKQARKSADDFVEEAPGRGRLASAGHEESKGANDVVDRETQMKKVNDIWDTTVVTRARRRNPAYQPFAETVSRGVPILTWRS